MPQEDLDALSPAYHASFKFTDENLILLSWYAKRIVATLLRERTEHLLSLGVGHQIVAQTILTAVADTLASYTIVEGSQTIIAEFREKMAGLPDWVRIEHAWFEEFSAAKPLDAIEMGFVLEHVNDPALVLGRFAKMLRRGGTLFIAVPNARSLHRMIGHEAGLLDDVYQLSEYDLQYGHKRYFDMESLTKLVLAAGLMIRSVEGLYLKPLTTEQMKKLELPQEIYAGLCRLSVTLPEISNAIYIEATV